MGATARRAGAGATSAALPPVMKPWTHSRTWPVTVPSVLPAVLSCWRQVFQSTHAVLPAPEIGKAGSEAPAAVRAAMHSRAHQSLSFVFMPISSRLILARLGRLQRKKTASFVKNWRREGSGFLGSAEDSTGKQRNSEDRLPGDDWHPLYVDSQPSIRRAGFVALNAQVARSSRESARHRCGSVRVQCVRLP